MSAPPPPPPPPPGNGSPPAGETASAPTENTSFTPVAASSENTQPQADGEHTSLQVWERPWSIAELRKGAVEGWTLAADSGLQRTLAMYAERMLNRAQATNADVDSLVSETHSATIRVSNCVNSLLQLSASQFIEHRVFQAEVKVDAGESADSAETGEKERISENEGKPASATDESIKKKPKSQQELHALLVPRYSVAIGAGLQAIESNLATQKARENELRAIEAQYDSAAERRLQDLDGAAAAGGGADGDTENVDENFDGAIAFSADFREDEAQTAAQKALAGWRGLASWERHPLPFIIGTPAWEGDAQVGLLYAEDEDDGAFDDADGNGDVGGSSALEDGFGGNHALAAGSDYDDDSFFSSEGEGDAVVVGYHQDGVSGDASDGFDNSVGNHRPAANGTYSEGESDGQEEEYYDNRQAPRTFKPPPVPPPRNGPPPVPSRDGRGSLYEGDGYGDEGYDEQAEDQSSELSEDAAYASSDDDTRSGRPGGAFAPPGMNNLIGDLAGAIAAKTGEAPPESETAAARRAEKEQRRQERREARAAHEAKKERHLSSRADRRERAASVRQSRDIASAEGQPDLYGAEIPRDKSRSDKRKHRKEKRQKASSPPPKDSKPKSQTAASLFGGDDGDEDDVFGAADSFFGIGPSKTRITFGDSDDDEPGGLFGDFGGSKPRMGLTFDDDAPASTAEPRAGVPAKKKAASGLFGDDSPSEGEEPVEPAASKPKRPAGAVAALPGLFGDDFSAQAPAKKLSAGGLFADEAPTPAADVVQPVPAKKKLSLFDDASDDEPATVSAPTSKVKSSSSSLFGDDFSEPTSKSSSDSKGSLFGDEPKPAAEGPKLTTKKSSGGLFGDDGAEEVGSRPRPQTASAPSSSVHKKTSSLFGEDDESAGTSSNKPASSLFENDVSGVPTSSTKTTALPASKSSPKVGLFGDDTLPNAGKKSANEVVVEKKRPVGAVAVMPSLFGLEDGAKTVPTSKATTAVVAKTASSLFGDDEEIDTSTSFTSSPKARTAPSEKPPPAKKSSSLFGEDDNVISEPKKAGGGLFSDDKKAATKASATKSKSLFGDDDLSDDISITSKPASAASGLFEDSSSSQAPKPATRKPLGLFESVDVSTKAGSPGHETKVAIASKAEPAGLFAEPAERTAATTKSSSLFGDSEPATVAAQKSVSLFGEAADLTPRPKVPAKAQVQPQKESQRASIDPLGGPAKASAKVDPAATSKISAASSRIAGLQSKLALNPLLLGGGAPGSQTQSSGSGSSTGGSSPLNDPPLSVASAVSETNVASFPTKALDVSAAKSRSRGASGRRAPSRRRGGKSSTGKKVPATASKEDVKFVSEPVKSAAVPQASPLLADDLPNATLTKPAGTASLFDDISSQIPPVATKPSLFDDFIPSTTSPLVEAGPAGLNAAQAEQTKPAAKLTTGSGVSLFDTDATQLKPAAKPSTASGATLFDSDTDQLFSADPSGTPTTSSSASKTHTSSSSLFADGLPSPSKASETAPTASTSPSSLFGTTTDKASASEESISLFANSSGSAAAGQRKMASSSGSNADDSATSIFGDPTSKKSKAAPPSIFGDPTGGKTTTKKKRGKKPAPKSLF